MWCADRRRIRLPHLNANCRPFAELDAWPNEAGPPGWVGGYSSLPL